MSGINIFIFKAVHFLKIITKLVTSVPFIILTIFGNLIVFIFTTLVYFVEKDVNPKMNEFFDVLWWSFSTTSTVGYGDIVPVTVLGKIIGILLMLIGVALFGIYTALFARTIIDDKDYME